MEANNIIIIQGEEEKKKRIHYEIDLSQEPIGKGGTGVVRSSVMVDERTGSRCDVAIKFLYDDMPANILIRSQREASIHVLSENLVEMIGFVQINGHDAQGRTIVHSHVVSELLHGVMLLDILKGSTTDKDGKEVPAAKEYHDLMLVDRNRFALKIVRNVLSGIQALHDNGYIHRDIDPSNIMITDRGKVKLIDLGIAKKIDTMSSPDEQHLTSTGQFIGKAAYAAPELVLGDLANQNETTDIYAIGVMLYLIVVGKLPFNGSLQEILNQQCTKKMPVQDIKDKNIRKIVKKATEKRQSDRYQSAAEFRVAIDAATRQMKPVRTAPAVVPVVNYIGIGALAAVVIVSLIFVFWSKSNSGGGAEPVQQTTAVSAQENNTESVSQPIEAEHVESVSPEMSNETESTPKTEEKPTPVAVDKSTSAPVQKSVATPAEKTSTAAKPSTKATPTASGSMKLSYGTYIGPVKNGYPNGKGKLVYSTSRRINKYDSKGIVAQPGEYVEGLFVNGFLTVGKHYSANGELLNKINAGVAEGVYESK